MSAAHAQIMPLFGVSLSSYEIADHDGSEPLARWTRRELGAMLASLADGRDSLPESRDLFAEIVDGFGDGGDGLGE
jgi:hypothetical protein